MENVSKRLSRFLCCFSCELRSMELIISVLILVTQSWAMYILLFLFSHTATKDLLFWQLYFSPELQLFT